MSVERTRETENKGARERGHGSAERFGVAYRLSDALVEIQRARWGDAIWYLTYAVDDAYDQEPPASVRELCRRIRTAVREA